MPLRTITHPSSKTLVESVTIFSSSKNSRNVGVPRTMDIINGAAEVVRSLTVGLKAGPNKIFITGLSSSIDKRSVRVSVKGGPATCLVDLVCTTDNSPNPNLSDSSEGVLATLHARRKVLKKIKAIHEHEFFVLFEYGRSLKSQNHIGSEQVTSFLQTFSEKAKQSVEEEARIDNEILSLDNQIEEYEHTMKAKVGEVKGKVQLILVAENDGQVDIKLTYVVSGASWNSVYELHAKNVDGKPSSSVVLNYNAQITQGTGEDWNDTVIKLSTSSNDLSTSRTIPQLRGVKLHSNQAIPATQRYIRSTLSSIQGVQTRSGTPPVPSPPVHVAESRSFPVDGGVRSSLPSGAEASYSIQKHPEKPSSTSDLPDSSMIIMKSSVSLIYAVQGLTSIPSDGLPHQVPVAKLPFEAKISHVCVPWIEPDVYLRCSIKNTSDYKIFSGSVNVLFDDTLVSMSSLRDVDIGDEFECSLGTDPDIHVTYSRKHSPPKAEGGGFSETFKSTDVFAKVSIRNKHAYKIEELYIEDGIPIPDDKTFKVILQKPEGLAEVNGDDEVNVRDGVSIRWKGGASGKAEGLFEWISCIDSGKSMGLETSWTVRALEHITWMEIKA